MDFSDLQMIDTNILELKHPVTDEVLKDKDGNICSLEIYGPHTDIFEKAQSEMEKRIERNKKLNKDDKIIYLSFYEAITKEIHNVYENEQPVTDSLYFFQKFQWVSSQVNDFLSDTGNFLKNPYKD